MIEQNIAFRASANPSKDSAWAMRYEINASPETGQNQHPVTLHTSIVL